MILDKTFFEFISTRIYGKNYSLDERYQSNKKLVEVLVNDLQNLDIEEISPLNREKTHILRQYYGILNGGKRQTLRDIAKHIDKSHERVRTIIKSSEARLFKVLLYWPKKQDDEKINEGILDDLQDTKSDYTKKKPSSLMLSDQYEQLKEKSLITLGFSYEIIVALYEIGVKNLEELLTLSKFDLTNKKISEKFVHQIEQKMISMNLRFIEDLSKKEKERLFFMSAYKDKKKLTSAFIHSNDQLGIYREQREYGPDFLKTLGETFSFISYSSLDIPQEVINDLKDLGFSISINRKVELLTRDYEDSKGKISAILHQNYSLDELATVEIRHLGINGHGIQALYRNNIYTVRDLLKLNCNDLFCIAGFGSKSRVEIVELIHGLGLYFADEVEILKAYSELIHEQLEDNKSTLVLRKKN